MGRGPDKALFAPETAILAGNNCPEGLNPKDRRPAAKRKEPKEKELSLLYSYFLIKT